MEDTVSFIIYGIYDPISNDIKYVGKTSASLASRLNCHIYKAKSGRSRSRMSLWILEILNKNLRPKIQALEIVQDNDAYWGEYERRWIKSFSGLLNTAEGGIGATTRVVFDKETLDLFGKIPDGEIAKKTGLCRETIAYHRRKLGISVAPKESIKYNPYNKGRPSPNRKKFDDNVVRMMGHVPDHVIAKMANVSRDTVKGFRKRNNIKRYIMCGENHPRAILSKDKVEYILFLKDKYSIKEIAKIMNTSYATIWDVINKRRWNKDSDILDIVIV